jgi:hypothetical protein
MAMSGHAQQQSANDHVFAMYLQALAAEEFLGMKGASSEDGDLAVSIFLDELNSMGVDTMAAARLRDQDVESLQAAVDMDAGFRAMAAQEASDAYYARALVGTRGFPAPPSPARPLSVPSLLSTSIKVCADNRIDVNKALQDGSVAIIKRREGAQFAIDAAEKTKMKMMMKHLFARCSLMQT